MDVDINIGNSPNKILPFPIFNADNRSSINGKNNIVNLKANNSTNNAVINSTTTSQKITTALPVPLDDIDLDVMDHGFVNYVIPVVCCLCRKIIAKENTIRQFLLNKAQ